MSFRGRRLLPRGVALALLALAAVGPVPALAGGAATAQAPSAPEKARQVPEPRLQQPGDAAGYRFPFEAGTEVTIEQGWNTTFSHNGRAAYAYDFGLPIGTKVLAAAAGVVSYVHEGETACGGKDLLLDANLVTIDHPDGSATQYGHLSTVDVKVGEVVAAGQVIATSGDTGYSQCIPHLHFARQYQGRIVSQSVPVYFQGYASRQFHTGDVVSVPAPACAASPRAADAADAAHAAQVPDAAGAAGAGKAPAAVRSRAVATVERTLGAFCGTYLADSLDVPQSFTRQDGFLNFDWRAKGPGGYWLNAADLGFSASWSGRFAFASAGRYTIGVVSSGAVIVAIDGVRVIDRWVDPGKPVEFNVSKVLGAGIHRIDVEYLTTNGQGVLKVGWGRLFADE